MNHLACLDRDGFCVLPNVFSASDCDRLVAEWQIASAADGQGVMRNANGAIYGARNVVELWPNSLQVLNQANLMKFIESVLGPDFGLVRVLYFDKTPCESWALPWHKDTAIAVRDNQLTSEHFDHPTSKYGVPHVEAPEWLLNRMLTARLHLDDVTEDNGPLRVIPGSHRGDKKFTGDGNEEKVLCNRGDVLLMRPLLSHASGHSSESTTRHRRILHFEFGGQRNLPDGFKWHMFIDPKQRPLQSDRSQLEAAYLATDYCVDDSPNGPFVIRIGERCDELEELLIESVAVDWAFISACNPRSQPISESENELRMEDLKRELEDRDLKFLAGRGQARDSDWFEPSFLVLNYTLRDARRLAKKFEQNAIVVGRIGELPRLVWC